MQLLYDNGYVPAGRMPQVLSVEFFRVLRVDRQCSFGAYSFFGMDKGVVRYCAPQDTEVALGPLLWPQGLAERSKRRACADMARSYALGQMTNHMVNLLI